MGLGDIISGVAGPDTLGMTDLNYVGGDYRNAINQYTSGLPAIYQSEAQYEPLYNLLGLQNTRGQLFGQNGTPGLLQDYSAAVPTIAGAGAAGNQVLRQANVGDVATLGNAAANAVRGINPNQTSLLNLLTNQTQQQLGMDNQLDPAQTRLVQQSVRQGQAARGLGQGPADIYGETMAASGYGDQLRQQRQAAASNVLGLNNNLVSLPALSLATGTSDAGGTGQNLLGLGTSAGKTAGPTLLPPSQSYDLFNTLFNARTGMNVYNTNAQNASDQRLYQGIGNMTTSVLGSAGMGA